MTAQQPQGEWMPDRSLRQLHFLYWLLGWCAFALTVIVSLVAFIAVAGGAPLARWPTASIIIAAAPPMLSGLALFVVLLDPTGVLGRSLSLIRVASTPENRREARRLLAFGYIVLPLLLAAANIFFAFSNGSLLQIASKSGIGTALILFFSNLAVFALMILVTRLVPRVLKLLPEINELRHRRVSHH